MEMERAWKMCCITILGACVSLLWKPDSHVGIHTHTHTHTQALRVQVGEHSEIGANCTIDRGSWRDTTLGVHRSVWTSWSACGSIRLMTQTPNPETPNPKPETAPKDTLTRTQKRETCRQEYRRKHAGAQGRCENVYTRMPTPTPRCRHKYESMHAITTM